MYFKFKNYQAMKKKKVDELLSRNILSLLEKGYSSGEIEHNLLAEGHDARSVKQLMYQLLRFQSGRRKVQAATLILGGAVLCLFSLLLAIVGPHLHHSFYTTVYGLASISALLVFAGVLINLVD